MEAGAHDIREGGRWSASQRAKNDLLYVLVVGALATIGRLPRPLLRAFGIAPSGSGRGTDAD